MTVFTIKNFPDIVLAIPGRTFNGGVIVHPLQKAGVIPHLSTLPSKFLPFRGVGSSVSHAMQNLAKGAPHEGSGGI